MIKIGKLRVNILDIIIIVLILGLLAGAGLKYLHAGQTNVVKTTSEFYVTYKTIPIDEIQLGGVHVGDLLSEQYLDPLGTIVSVSTQRATLLLHDNNGGSFLAPQQGMVNIYITVKASGSIVGNDYLINGNNNAAPGQQPMVITKRFLAQAEVYSVSQTLPTPVPGSSPLPQDSAAPYATTTN